MWNVLKTIVLYAFREFMLYELYHDKIVNKNKHVGDFGKLVTFLVSFRNSSVDASVGDSFCLVPKLWWVSGASREFVKKIRIHGSHP